MDKKQIGLWVEGVGAASVFIGAVLSFHHISIAITIGLGLAAIYIGRQLHLGAL